MGTSCRRCWRAMVTPIHTPLRRRKAAHTGNTNPAQTNGSLVTLLIPAARSAGIAHACDAPQRYKAMPIRLTTRIATALRLTRARVLSVLAAESIEER